MPCLMAPIVKRQSEEIDQAHHKLRELQSALVGITGINDQCMERLTRVEEQSSRHTVLMETLRGEIDGVGIKQDAILARLESVEEVGHDTNALIKRHINESTQAASEDHLDRLREVERIAGKLVKITVLLSMIVVALGATYKILSGEALSFLLGWLQ